MKKDKSIKKKSIEIALENAHRYAPSYQEGLSTAQVEERKAEKLVNKKNKNLSKTLAQIIFHNVFTFFNILLLCIGVALIVVKQYNNLFFLAIAFANTMIGIYQEYKAKKMVDSLKLLTAPTSGIVRNGKEEIYPSEEIVLDDIVVISAGKEIPVDGIVVAGVAEINESLLTGESIALKKEKNANVLAGSYVVSGTIYVRALAIGEFTYISKLQVEAKKQKKVKSILLSSLNRIIKWISFIIIPLGMAIFCNNYFLQKETIQFAVASTAGCMVAMIPAGLFLLVSSRLFLSVFILGKKHALVQELYSIESLARSNVLCLDKTGTITDGTMHLTKVINYNQEVDLNDLMCSFLSSFKESNLTSDALKRKYNHEGSLISTLVIPFSSERKYSAVTLNDGYTYFLGAFEYLCEDKKILNEIEPELNKGNRVLIFKRIHANYDHELAKSGEVISIFVLEDHIRDDAFEIIKWFQDNDVELKVISGDNPNSVHKIAEKVGIKNSDKYISLENMSLEEVEKKALEYTIFGRVNPEQKATIVKALKSNSKTVAMTGDGVNDILALKQANCSIAMASGSEATRNVASVVLMDSSFSSMPHIVKEGRIVINNIQYASSLFLMKTIYAILLSFLVLILALCNLDSSYPFEPKHLYILEFAVIGIPSIFLAIQPNDNLVPDNFFQKIIIQAIPGGVALLFSAVFVVYIERYIPFFELQNNYIITACLSLSLTGLIILFKLCYPFNLYRIFVYIGMLIVTSIILLLPADFTGFGIDNLKQLSIYNVLGLIISSILAICIYFLMNLLIHKKEHKINKVLEKTFKADKDEKSHM